MIKKVFGNVLCILKYVPSCSVVAFFVKNAHIALQILYLFHMDFLLKIGNKFEIF